MTMEIKGRNLVAGVPLTITVDDGEIREKPSANAFATIMNAIRVRWSARPPSFPPDISDRGIVLTGGGALLKNLDKRIREEPGCGFYCRRSALQRCVGTARCSETSRLLRKISIE